MRKIIEVSLETDELSRKQITEIVREMESGEQTREVLIEQPLTLEDRGHEMHLDR